jgi:hypothetical protein
MERARTTIAALGVAMLVFGTAITGCGNNKTSSPSAAGPIASPTGAPLADYTALLIKASDIGGDYTAAQPPSQNPNGTAGVAQLFTGPDNSRRIGDTILIAADAAAAVAGLENSKKNFLGKVSGGTWQPADVGSNGAILSGTSPDNSQAVIVLFFSEGKALVDLEFNSAPNDPIDPGVATDIGRKQDAAIKSGLPS